MWSQSFFLIAFPAIFTIVNPLAALGPFLGMTAKMTNQGKNSTAQRACLVAGLVLIVCAAIGSFLFDFFGITLPALKIAGGILLFTVAFDMVNARQTRSKTTEEERLEGAHKSDIAIFPLSIPILSGPGSMVSVLILEQRAKTFVEQGMIYCSILITMMIGYLMLSHAKYIARILGATGINVVGRLMGLVLSAIAVQAVISGVSEAFPAMARVVGQSHYDSAAPGPAFE